ncbi:MAG: CDP-alcohol phosphatidyltransferase family protein [Phycisphaerales bacterium]
MKGFSGEPDVPVWALVPNFITTLALSCGLASIYFSMQQKFALAMGAIILSGIFDVLDGRAARMLKASSRFGAVLDSLSDFLSFGVAPAVLVLQGDLVQENAFGLAAAMTYAICAAIRLARFTSAAYAPPRPDAPSSMFFTGMPSPAAAGTAMIPPMLMESATLAPLKLSIPPALVALHMIVIGLLMISRLPMFSIKKVRIARGLIAPLLVVLGLIVAAAVRDVWLTLSVLAVVYLSLIPFAFAARRREKARQVAPAAVS